MPEILPLLIAPKMVVLLGRVAAAAAEGVRHGSASRCVLSLRYLQRCDAMVNNALIDDRDL